MTLRPALAVGLVAVLAACPSKQVCDRNVDLSAKAGACTGVPTGNLLGDSSTCSTRVAVCDTTEQNTLSDALTCFEGLPTCTPADQAKWTTDQTACNAKLSSLSKTCKESLFGGTLPGEDAGFDAGPPPDAGRQPLDDGGAGVSLVAVADEKNFAFAWAPLQRTSISSWELNSFDLGEPDGGTKLDGGTRLTDIYIPGNIDTSVYEQRNVGSGAQRRFYLAGLDSMGNVAIGVVEVPDAGMMMTDGGMVCAQHAQCPMAQVCDLNQCKTQTCMTSTTCPQPDYICNINVMPMRCERTGTSMGIDAGMMMVQSGALPMISHSVSVKTGPPQFSGGFIGGFQGRRPDMVAIDSARQFVALEQGNAPVGHFTVSRGEDFKIDAVSTVAIDTVGSNVHVAYNADNKVIYACYTVGRGVRVRRSNDYGKNWGTSAVTFEPVDDGGVASSIGDCDIAPWKNGTALMVTVDDGYLVVRQINQALGLNGAEETAFVPSPTDGGGYNVFFPRHPSIATLPASDLVHIGFTGSRIVSGLTDTDIFGVYRDTTSGGVFSNPAFINRTSVVSGSTFSQDYPQLAVDPLTGRGVAVWTSLENTGAGLYTTVYLGFFNNTNKQWVTGADLSVFMTTQMGVVYPLFPQRTTGLWDAFAPQISALRDGRIFLMYLAGERMTAGASDIYAYANEFAFDAGSPVGGIGWFKPPALKMSNTKAVDPRGGGNSVPASNTAFATDSQISIYGTFIEATGAQNEIENRGVFVKRP